MQRHSFDPLSAVLGVLTVVGAVAVMTGSLRPTATWVGIAVAGGLGLLMVIVAVQRLTDARRAGSDPLP